MPPESVLITGCSGTVGTALAEELLDRGYDITGVDVVSNPWNDELKERTLVQDLTDESGTKTLPESVDLIIHLAANARVHKLVQNPELAKENLDMTFTVLEYARDINADIIFTSSREVYGNAGQVIYSETDTYVDECESPYTASKIGGEALVKSYKKCYDIDACIVRLSNVYGRYDVSDRVVPLFIALALQNQNLTVYGTEKILDFTYIDDCVDGLVKVVEQFSKSTGTTYNIASGQGSSLVEVAEMIIEETDSEASINVEANRTGEVSQYVADISKANKLLGYEPQYSIRKGIEETIDWYRTRNHLLDNILS